jgi:hypothetical protein
MFVHFKLVACVNVISAQIVTVWLCLELSLCHHPPPPQLAPVPTRSASAVYGQTVSTKHCLKTIFAIFPPIAIFKSLVCCAAFDIKLDHVIAFRDLLCKFLHVQLCLLGLCPDVT